MEGAEREMEGEKLVGWKVKVTFARGKKKTREWHAGFIIKHQEFCGSDRYERGLLPQDLDERVAEHGEPPATRRRLPPAGSSGAAGERGGSASRSRAAVPRRRRR